MATTYAMPPTPGFGGHGHSHSRKSAPQRDPLDSPASSAAYQFNAMPVHMNSFNPSSNLQNDPPKIVEAFPDLQPHQNQHSNLQLPKPPSFSSPSNSRRKSMERRKSAGLPTHLNLTGNEYGFPKARVQKFQQHEMEAVRPWVSIPETVSTVLVLLPYALSSVVFAMGIRPRSFEHNQAFSAMEPSLEKVVMTAGTPIATNSMSLVCGLTAATLALLGLGGKVAQWRGTKHSSEIFVSIKQLRHASLMQPGRAIAGRVVTVGLPFFATSQLGAARISTILLAALVSKVMVVEERTRETRTWKWWKGLATHRMWTILSFFTQVVFDLSGLTSDKSITAMGLGYVAIGLMIFILPPSYPSSTPKSTAVNSHSRSTDTSSKERLSSKILSTSPLISTPEDIDLTLLTAVLLGILGYCLSLIKDLSAGATFHHQIAWSVLTSLSAAVALIFTNTQALERSRGFGSSLGLLCLFLLIKIVHNDTWIPFAYQSLLVSISSIALIIDSSIKSSPESQPAHHDQHHHHHHHHGTVHVGEIAGASRFTNHVLRWVQNWPLLHTILVEKDSRRIFYFMCLNFAFMLVQTFYGIVSGSLGLLSDSIHMFFDCLALIVGLTAAVMSKWPPSARFPYGYAKIETLAGFANGIFLMLISIEIIYEALERLLVGSNVKRLNELMTVSVLGFLINVIGILAFGHAHHGHDHSHGHSHDHHHHEHASRSDSDREQTHTHSPCDHGHQHLSDHHHKSQCHEHMNHENLKPKSSPPILNGHARSPPETSLVPSPSPSIYSSVPVTPAKSPAHVHAHGGQKHHDHHHDHHHSENMMGIYLHVLGDTLGSAAVVLSTWLVQLNGWSGWDPIASTGIALIIFGTAIPLVKNCARKLLLTVPEDTEYDLREALAGVSGLKGVVGCAVPKFWIQEGEGRQVMGVVHVMADKVSNLEDVQERCFAFLKAAGLDVLVQVERDGGGRCWCQAAK